MLIKVSMHVNKKLACMLIWPYKRLLWLEVCNYAIMQLCNYASMQVCNYASLQVCKYVRMQVWKFASMQVLKRMLES